MNIKKIGVLTSGGDSPGMNAVVRAIVRTAVNSNMEVVGIKRGYEGLLAGEIVPLNSKSVSDIIHRGGTMLLSARCPEMHEEKAQRRAVEIAGVLGLDTLVVIGGDGTFKGGLALSRLGLNVIGIPATIDMDLSYTDYTIGFDTAVNTAMEAINKIRDTSGSHERCSVVEVMGRDCGNIALWCSITSGAEEVIIPESPINPQDVIKVVIENRSRGKSHNLIVVAEGIGNSAALAKKIEEITGIETRASILGYLQRGGSPTALDRLHGSMMGYKAVGLIAEGAKNKAIGFSKGEYPPFDLDYALSIGKSYDDSLYKAVKTLSI